MRALFLFLALLLVPVSSLAQGEDIPLPRPRPERPAAETQAPKPEPDAQRPAPADPGTPQAKPENAPANSTAAPANAAAPAPANAAAPPPGTGTAAPGNAAAAPGNAQPAAQPPPEGEAKNEPGRIYQTACPAVMMGLVEAKPLPPITEGGCSEHNPLSLSAVLVNGRMVPVTGNVTTNCAMATTLPQWVSQVDGYFWAHENLHVTAVDVGTSLMCRNVVGSSDSSRLSEHSFADAVDVTGFTLSDKRTISVGTGWTGTEEQGKSALHYAHDAACSIFMTTLGPDANAAHHDHFHVDFGCHGKTCTARLCE